MKIAIFGSGDFGKQALEEYGVDQVDYFIDNNRDKWGTQYQEKPIISFERYREIAQEYHTVIAVDAFSAIVKQLQNNGILVYEIYNPLYKKKLDELKDHISINDNILLYGVDEKTEIILNFLIQGGISKERIFFGDTKENIKKKPSFQGFEIFQMEEIVTQIDTIIVSSEIRAYALQARLEREIKNKCILNPFVRREYGKKNCLIVNPYEGVEHDTTEQEWINQNGNEIIRFSIQSYMEELAKDVPLFQHIEIETYNRCNGVCSFCPVSIENEKRPLMKMEESLFQKIINQLSQMDYGGSLAIFSNNEPFLDERIVSFNRYARDKLPKAHMYLFTNGTVLQLDDFIEIMSYLDEIIIDNYNQELKLIPPIKRIVEYCEEHSKLKEKVTVVMRKPVEVLTSRGGDAPNRKRTDYMASCGCIMPFKQMIVRPDGKVSLCCNDPYGRSTMGDLSKESVSDVWYGEKFRRARKAILKGRGNYDACRYCDTTQLF